MARDLSRNRKKTIQINRYLENKIAILREPILPTWQCSCKERRKQSALARWAKDHPTREPSVYPVWRLFARPVFAPPSAHPIPNCAWENPFPRLRGTGTHEKNARIFFMGTREGGRRPEGGNTKLAFIPLGSCSQTQYSSHLTTARKPGVYPAWRAPNPEPYTERIPSLACGGRGSHEKNARIFFMGTREGSRRPEGGNTKPAFIPLGGYPQTQCLSRLVAAHKSSGYHA